MTYIGKGYLRFINNNTYFGLIFGDFGAKIAWNKPANHLCLGISINRNFYGIR